MMITKGRLSGSICKYLITAVFCLVAIHSAAQSPSGAYKITIKTGRLNRNTDRVPKGSTLYLKKHNYQSNQTVVIDSAVMDRKKAVFSGPVYALDTKIAQEKVFTAGQYDVCDNDGPLFSFFSSSIDGENFIITFRHRSSLVYHYYNWETDGSKSGLFSKENITYLQYQNYLMFKALSMSRDSSEALAAEYAVNTLFPGGDKVVTKRLLFQVEKEAPGSLTESLLSLTLDGVTSEKSSQLPLVADERLVYTSFARNLIDIFLDKFKFSRESVRNMAIDYLMENRYLTAPKMMAAVAMECFRRYSSSVVMGCEGSAVYAAEKYILNNGAVSPSDKAEAAWYVTVNKGTLVGAKAPQLSLKDTSGVERSISELMGDHSIIYFYSDDCAYCKEETPKLVSLLDSWNEFPINIAAVYTGTDADLWKKYINNHFKTNNPYISWIHLADLDRESNFPVDYGVVSTPKLFLLDESLRIRGRGILTPTLTAMLKEQAEEDNKAYNYLSQIFPAEELSPDSALDLEARKDAVDKIYEGVKTSDSFSRLMRQAFTYLFFCGYAPNTQTALYLGQKYVLDMPERWEDTVFVSSIGSIMKAANMNAPGSKAGNLTLYDIADNPADLLLPDGKMKVLYFYRTGCEVCKETLPEIRNVWKKYGKKVSFTGIFAGDNVKEFRKFVSSNSLEFRQLYAKDNLAELGDKYYIEAVPLILAIDNNGTVIYKGTSAEKLNEILK
ncbi:MAG: TlpA family protein disulfide reductase [Bacteroidales bacterium]|nr:TlpA family protein disulfide reductase [Bacteroidales bacterium]